MNAPRLWRLVVAAALVSASHWLSTTACKLAEITPDELRAPHRKLTPADVARVYQEKVRGTRAS